MSRQVAIDLSGVIAINTDVFTVDTATDSISAFTMQVVSVGTTGALTLQGSNDGVTWISAMAQRDLSIPTSTLTAGSMAFVNSIFRFYRIRMTTATTAGSTTLRIALFNRSETDILGNNAYVSASISQSTGATTPGISVQPYNFTRDDIPSATITSTSTGSAIDVSLHGDTGVIMVAASAVGGTSPTFDVAVQESQDSGTTWYTVYHFPRITANGTWYSPLLRFNGNRIRYVRTVGGTSPTATMVVRRINHAQSIGTPCRRIFDRSIVFNTGSSVTAVLETAEWGDSTRVTVVMGTATTPPVLAIEASEDNSNWYQIGTDLTPVASSTTSQIVIGACPPFIRVRVKTAGVSAIVGYVAIRTT